MSEVHISQVREDKGLLVVDGVVNGRRVTTTGWAERWKHAKSPAHARRYAEQLLMDCDGLAVSAKEIPWYRVAQHWILVNWITVTVSVILSGILDLLVRK